MIITVTPNPALDRMYFVDAFDFKQGHRVDNFNVTAGGKGLNVTKVLDVLSCDVLATGFLGGMEGKAIKSKLSSTNAELAFVDIEQPSRTTISIADQNGKTLELVENGPTIHKHEQALFEQGFLDNLAKGEVAVFSGSLARGLPEGFYRKHVDMAKRAGLFTIVDASGETLRESLKAGPDLIKPNLEELESLLGKRLDSTRAIVDASRELMAMGAGSVAVSLGASGMVYVDGEAAYRVEVPAVDVVSPVGSGDSVVAGFAYTRIHQRLTEETLAFANACGVSNAMNNEIGSIKLEDVFELQSRIKVTKL